eukprot:CAMPEP_0176497884 /NCGR_PEP_ID=MMETSP0200_2-20121128/11991_1 /TAXON_ID=947934 /ORGANISM="Chaetoceros sp., Strain GSL56" /LENGTH=577 /DNA_ID=CAMNT_0017895985 /DNA_START=52 /DNA_END=1781 /DNA_ORIENTATION=+
MCSSKSPPTKQPQHSNYDGGISNNAGGLIENAIFFLIMTLALTSVYSAALQLEKVYYDGFEHEKFIYKVPYISSLKVPESFAYCTFTLFVLALYAMRQRSLLQRANLHMPMVPSYIPILGTALQFLTHTPWDLMESWHRTYGPIYAFKLLGKTCISIEQPEYLKEMLQSKIQNVKKDSNFSYKPFLPILGTGIVTSEGKSWMDQRRKISTALKVDVLELIPGATLGAVQRLMIKMDKCIETQTTLDIAEELRHLTLQVISECFLSLEAQESDTTFATMYLPIVEEGNKRVWSPERSFMFFMPFFWRHIFGIKRLNRYVSKLIVDRWNLRKMERNSGRDHSSRNETRRKEDVLDMVLGHFENENPGKELDSNWIRQLRDEFKTFMLAGHETSAAMMTWVFFELMKKNHIKKEVEKEAAKVFGNKDWLQSGMDATCLPTREELSQLELSEACLKESLRLYSVVPCVMRQTIKPTKVGNHIIPAGCNININIQSVHHNDKYWPNPMVYDPSRFTSDAKSSRAPFTFLPFIDGPRNCLGQYLALLESKMVVSLISQRYDLRLVKKELAGDEDPRHRFIVPV